MNNVQLEKTDNFPNNVKQGDIFAEKSTTKVISTTFYILCRTHHEGNGKKSTGVYNLFDLKTGNRYTDKKIIDIGDFVEYVMNGNTAFSTMSWLGPCKITVSPNR